MFVLIIFRIGIFPLFVNASMQVKPKMLQLYETHFLPLEDNLACCIDGMLLSLLPGIFVLSFYIDYFYKLQFLSLNQQCSTCSPY